MCPLWNSVLWWSILAVISGTAFAQAPAKRPREGYPGKIIRLVVPYPAGGGVDLVARLIAQKLSEGLGQPIVLDNRSGAGGTIGLSSLARSLPDGYTLGMGVTANLAIAPALYPRLDYDPQKDFELITFFASIPLVVVVHPSLPVRSVKDLISLARARPGQINYSSTGNGTPGHLATEHFKTLAKLNMVHVPYKGGPPAVNALISGEVSVAFNPALTALPHIRSNRLRVIAVTGERRIDILPDVPTVSDSGVPGYHVAQWYGMLAPAGTPAGIVRYLNQEIRRVIQIREVKTALLAEGAELSDATPEQFREFLRGEIANWGTMVRNSGARLD